MKTDNAIQALEDMATACTELAELLRRGRDGAVRLDDPRVITAAAAYSGAARRASLCFLDWTRELSGLLALEN
jgi:hypothetical protein